MPRPDEFLTVREVAEVLGVTTQRVYQLVKNGVLPATRFGRRAQVILIATDSLQQYCEARQSRGH